MVEKRDMEYRLAVILSCNFTWIVNDAEIEWAVEESVRKLDTAKLAFYAIGVRRKVEDIEEDVGCWARQGKEEVVSLWEYLHDIVYAVFCARTVEVLQQHNCRP